MVSIPLSNDLLIIVALILAGLLLWYASYKSESKLKKVIEKEADATLFQSQFRCVVINPCDHSCRRALEFRARPILINDAPTLPLQGCNIKKCECSFVHYEDRRSGSDRREKEIFDSRRALVYANKRLFKDRRKPSISEYLLPQYRKLNLQR